MKKYLFIILIFLLCGSANAATYYAQGAGNINEVEWDTAPAGGGTDLVWANIQAEDILYANNNEITVNVSFTCAKISTAAGDGTAGGSFNVATNASPLTITAAIEAGTTACLIVTGTADANPALTIVGNVAAGPAAAAYGVSDSHTVGTVVFNGNAIAGPNATAHGYRFSGATGSVVMTGNGIGTASGSSGGYGITSTAYGGSMTITGNCVGSDTATGSAGCAATSTGNPLTIIGNLITGIMGPAAMGKCYFTPGADNYALFPKDGSYTNGTIDIHAAQLKLGGGGGGAWGF